MSQDPRALLQKADKALQGAGSGFSLFGGRTEKYENAADLYIQAASAFRMQKNGKEAGQTFEKAADVQQTKLNEPDDAANTLVEAFKVYRKTDPQEAVRVLEHVVAHHTGKGNFRRAAGHQQTLAELYEQDLGDEKKAMTAYETAAQWFDEENAEALANKLYLKTADLAALHGDYYKAIELFERIAKKSVDHNLMRYSVKEYLLKAGICHLATKDIVGANRAQSNFVEIDPSFGQQAEYQLLVDLTAATQQGDQEEFADKLFQYDQLRKLDNWKTTMLLRVKQDIEEEGEDFS